MVMERVLRLTAIATGAVLVGVIVSSCGSASISTPVATTPTPAPEPSVEPVVKLSGTGAVPQILHIFSGKTVTFVNNDDRPHVIQADPHPAHTQCSGRLNIGRMLPGERREVEVEYGLCFYHDEMDPANPAYMGMTILH
jgi:hypothetical protein